MKIYLAIIEDRHVDTDVHPFSTAEAAIEFARDAAKENCRHPEDFAESDIPGWLYYAVYSCEEDSVRVIEKELDAQE